MAKMYTGGDDGKAHKIKQFYIGGDDGKAHKVKKMYIGGDDGKAHLCYSLSNTVTVSVRCYWTYEPNHTFHQDTQYHATGSSLIDFHIDCAIVSGTLWQGQSITIAIDDDNQFYINMSGPSSWGQRDWPHFHIEPLTLDAEHTTVSYNQQFLTEWESNGGRNEGSSYVKIQGIYYTGSWAWLMGFEDVVPQDRSSVFSVTWS